MNDFVILETLCPKTPMKNRKFIVAYNNWLKLHGKAMRRKVKC